MFDVMNRRFVNVLAWHERHWETVVHADGVFAYALGKKRGSQVAD